MQVDAFDGGEAQRLAWQGPLSHEGPEVLAEAERDAVRPGHPPRGGGGHHRGVEEEQHDDPSAPAQPRPPSGREHGDGEQRAHQRWQQQHQAVLAQDALEQIHQGGRPGGREEHRHQQQAAHGVQHRQHGEQGQEAGGAERSFHPEGCQARGGWPAVASWREAAAAGKPSHP
ncbi:hypothetical protein ACLESD_47970, partial [Pyxidicoccus sp. 3LFB2]